MGKAHGAAEEAHVEALVAHAFLAVQALAARLAGIDRDTRARLHARDAFTNCGNDAGDLVPKRHRLLNAHGAEAAMVIIVQVGAADAAIGDLHTDFTGAGRGIGKAVDPQILRRVDDDGAHGFTPSARSVAGRDHIAAIMPPST